ncbi:glycosyltransferase [Paenibacillus sp. JSM ZJ436]|uniref:glycosyltransferase n=1 Tax=Paenibacillus sp. JSM ZJ436 TaxID=3376190 RepID=UPI0037966F43
MIQISLCMIVRDEEEVLERCLSSIHRLVDEIIIVDTGSTDRTKEIAAVFADRVVDFTWIDDFSAARNYAFSLATMPYILWLDADDYLKEGDEEAFLALKQLPEDIDSVTLPYYLSMNPSGGAASSLRRNRIVRSDRGFTWIGAVHEYLEVSGNIYHASPAIVHGKMKSHSDRNLRIYLKREEENLPFSSRDMYYFGNELSEHGQHEKAIQYYDRFLKQQGWVEDQIQACMRKADCYQKLGQKEKSLQSWLQTLEYDQPRPEFCCAFGEHLLEKREYRTAAYWFEQALSYELPKEHMSLVNEAYSTWIPHLKLCLSYSCMGKLDEAYFHNEQARSYQPEHPIIMYNYHFMKQMMQDKAGH